MNNSSQHILDLEKTIIGTLIIDASAYSTIFDRLFYDMFLYKQHKLIYLSIKELFEKDHKIDLISLDNNLTNKGHNLTSYLIEASNMISSSASLEQHVLYLAEIASKREFAIKFTELANLAKEDTTDVFDLQEKAFNYFDNFLLKKFSDNYRATHIFKDLVKNVEERVEKITAGQLSGIKSSLAIINKAIGGWQNTDLNIIAGRPGMGKTSFLVQSVLDAANQNIPVGIFSLEMSAEQITARLASNFIGIPNSSILRKGFQNFEKKLFEAEKETFSKLNIYIDDTSAISIHDLKMKAKSWKIKYDIKIVFIDYLQLLSVPGKQNREQEISTISRSLKALAKDLNIPVIALSQLSRQVEQRTDKRPLLSDLRDSGAIEQDADVVLFLYRPRYYGIQTWEEEYNYESTQDQIELIISKNRNGGTLADRLTVDLSQSKFENIESSLWIGHT